MKYLILTKFLLFSTMFLNAQCWELVWEDEFNGTQLDLTNWEYEIGGDGFGNQELQYYTNGNNVEVSNGTLKIIAREDLINQYPNNAYTSSRIRSKYMGDWTYGRFEARIKLPSGQGIWPAFWMLPTDQEYGGWPTSGEIDIMELLGHEPNKVYGTSHYGNSPANADHRYQTGSVTLPSGDFTDDFHTFAVEWEENQIRWYLDGVQYHTVYDIHPDFISSIWPYDQRYHFLLNVAVGGDWPGYPDGTTVFPVQMEVDYVRVYQELTDVVIEGKEAVLPNAQNESYSLPVIGGATYNWTVPSGATIASGQNTNEILVDWANTGGTISATITTACSSETYSIDVSTTTNLWDNYGFENGTDNWNTNLSGGAWANFNLTTAGSPEGSNHLCVDPTSLSGTSWHIQLGRNITLEAGEEYTLSFWAKSNGNNNDLDIFFIRNGAPYNSYASESFALTTAWQQYTFTFTASVNTDALFTIDLGDENATICFDDFHFSNLSDIVIPETLTLSFKVMLEGLMDGTTMNTTLNENGMIPQQQIFNTSPWLHNTTNQYSFLPAQGVDWILINIYDASGNIIETQTGIVYLNGDVYDVNIASDFNFSSLVADAKYASVHHKSHLAVVADIENLSGTRIDFTQSGVALGTQATKNINGVETMFAGDMDGNGVVNSDDFNIWSQNSSAVGQYLFQDIDGNGIVNNNDYNLWTINRSKIGNTIIGY